MTSPLNVITGATGLLGSHVAEVLRRRGERVRALVRPGSDIRFLHEIGAETVCGDLLVPASLYPVVAGADFVYHCAARIGNWGSWREFRRDVVETTRNLLDACAAGKVGRVLHASSIAVYGHPRSPGGRVITEDEPMGQRLGFLDYYARTKIQAERLAKSYPGALTVVRPGWIYGPRDRNSLPRLVRAIRDGWVSIIGDGENLLNIVHAADVAEGAIRAANCPEAVGQAFHLAIASESEITQRQFFNIVSTAVGLPPVTRHVSKRLARAGGLLGEAIGRWLSWNRSPHVTGYGIDLLTRPTNYSTAKARNVLSWQPRIRAEQGLQEALEWLLRKEEAG